MKNAKRITLFLATNLAIIVMLSLVMNLLGIQPYLSERGINYQSLMIFCLLWGFGASFISLLMSKKIAKWTHGVKTVDAETSRDNSSLRWLLESVERLSRQAGLKSVPEVGIYESPEVNAFATGPSEKRSLVAVSTGLLQTMDSDAVEGVLAHEIAHIKNGDMVTMTLIQGVVNAFVMFLSRAVAFFIGQTVRDEARFLVQIVCTIALDIVFGFFASMITASFSRKREFRADAGAARIAGRDKMISALKTLQRINPEVQHAQGASPVSALKISSSSKSFLSLFATHPPLELRIQKLEQGVV